MRRLLLACSVVLSVTLLLSSCLGDDDETVYPSDAAISGFSIGTLKRTVTTTSSTGADSTYTTTYTASNYKFYIDQINHRVYNPDSLPYGTDVKHVVCTITSRNSGTVTIKSLTSDSLTYFNSSDSIDFSEPRTFVVYSLDTRCKATYTVTVNVHQEAGNTFVWQEQPAESAFANAQQLKAFSHQGRIVVFAREGDQCTVWSCDETGNSQWSASSQTLPAEACGNAVVMGEYIYTLAGGHIMRTATGSVWEQDTPVPITQLLAADATTLYALSPDRSLMRSTDYGHNWEPDILDDDPILLPTSELSCCLIPSRVNPSISNIVLIGNRSVSEFDDDLRAYVWSKLTSNNGDQNEPWMYVNTDLDQFALPRLSSLTAVPYADGIVAAGGLGLGDCDTPGFSHFYYSGDGGIYWTPSTTYTMPAGMECNNVFTMAAGSDNYLWLICGGSGQVWRGRMSGVDPKHPTTITE